MRGDAVISYFFGRCVNMRNPRLYPSGSQYRKGTLIVRFGGDVSIPRYTTSLRNAHARMRQKRRAGCTTQTSAAADLILVLISLIKDSGQ
jgi:hypothetical protein